MWKVFQIYLMWDYIAGFFDGEGHCGCSSGKQEQLSVSLANTHIGSLKRMRDFLHAQGIPCTIYIESRQGIWKDCGSLVFTSNPAKLAFLLQMEGRCCVKLDAVRKGLAFLHSDKRLPRLRAKDIARAVALYRSGTMTTRAIAKLTGVSSRSFRLYAAR